MQAIAIIISDTIEDLDGHFFVRELILDVHAVDHRAAFIQQHGNTGHLGPALNVVLHNVADAAVPVFRKAGLDDSRWDRFFRRYALNGVITKIVADGVNHCFPCPFFLPFLTLF